ASTRAPRPGVPAVPAAPPDAPAASTWTLHTPGGTRKGAGAPKNPNRVVARKPSIPGQAKRSPATATRTATTTRERRRGRLRRVGCTGDQPATPLSRGDTDSVERSLSGPQLFGTIGAVEFRILGSLEVLAGDRVVPIEAPKPRALIAILLLHTNEPVSSDRLIEALWAGHAPATAAQSLRTYVFQLRKALGSGVIRTVPGGYELRTEPESVDAQRFEDLLDEARSAPPLAAAETLRKALALWRG